MFIFSKIICSLNIQSANCGYQLWQILLDTMTAPELRMHTTPQPSVWSTHFLDYVLTQLIQPQTRRKDLPWCKSQALVTTCSQTPSPSFSSTTGSSDCLQHSACPDSCGYYQPSKLPAEPFGWCSLPCLYLPKPARCVKTYYLNCSNYPC